MAQRIIFPEKSTVLLEEFTPVAVTAGQIRVRALVSLISTGTEGICLHRLFEPGTHWEDWVKYPFKTGYCMVGEVVEIGDGVTRHVVGDRVVARVTHASESVTDAAKAFPVPDGVPNEEAAWFALAMIGSMGVKAGEVRLGDDVLIVGAGPIGQMALRWSVASGAHRVVSMDTVQMRLDLAKRGGATSTLCISVEDSKDAVLKAFGGALPRVVIDTTGHAGVLEHALALPRRLGTLVVLGDTGSPSQQRLTRDVVTRGIRIVGAHVSHETAEWTEESIIRLFFSLSSRGRFNLEAMNTHLFSPEQCVDAYALMTERRAETMGLLFDWQG